MRRVFQTMARVVGLLVLLAGAATAQDGGYLIRAGDTLRIEVLEDPGLNRSVLVSPDGRITLPLAGGLRASGKPVEAVQAELSAKLAPNFAAAPNVYVSIERIVEPRVSNGTPRVLPTIDVYVIGEGAKPGKLAVAPGTTVLQFFAEMGGFSKFAATKRIQLRRTDASTGKEAIYGINYYAIERGLSRQGDTVLADDDVIVIPQRRLFE